MKYEKPLKVEEKHGKKSMLYNIELISKDGDIELETSHEDWNFEKLNWDTKKDIVKINYKFILISYNFINLFEKKKAFNCNS